MAPRWRRPTAEVDRSCGSRRTRPSRIGATGVELDDPDAIVEAEVGYVGAMVPVDEHRSSAPDRMAGAGRRPAFAQGVDRRRPGQAVLRRRRRRSSSSAAAYVDDLGRTAAAE